MTDCLTLRNPFDQGILEEIPFDSPAELSGKLAGARSAQVAWRRCPLDQRIAVVQAGLDRLRENADSICRDVTLQMGKPLAQSQGEFETLFDRAQQLIADAPDSLAPISCRRKRVLSVALNMRRWEWFSTWARGTIRWSFRST